MIRKAFDRLFSDKEFGKAAKREFERAMAKGDAGEGLPIFERWLFAERNEAGASVAERWREEGYSGLKNDETVLFQTRMGARLASIEVHRVLDDLRTEVVDLLDSERATLVIFDRSFAKRACRFQTAVGWIYDAPHFLRVCGGMISLPDFEEFEPLETLVEIADHLGGATKGGNLRGWLALNFEKFSEALTATSLARRKQMLEGVDAQFGKAEYELQAPFDECVAVLDGGADIAEDGLSGEETREGFLEARTWFEGDGESPTSLSGAVALGRALLGANRWRLVAMGQARLATLRERFENRMAGRVRFVSERRDDLAAQMRLKEPDFDESLVPPRLLEQERELLLSTTRIPVFEEPNSVEEALRRRDETFLDENVPMLGGSTPREAATDPQLRPKLIRMMKSRILSVDEENLRSGNNRRIDWMLEELGLSEIQFEPPPSREPLGDRFEDKDEDWDEEEERVDASHLPPAPRLPATPLTADEIDERIDGVPPFDSVEEVLERIRNSGSTLMGDMESLIGETVSDDEWLPFLPALTHLWFVLVPHGCSSPIWEFEDIRDAYRAEFMALGEYAKRGGEVDILAYVKESPQPTLAMESVNHYLDSCEQFSKGGRLKAKPNPAAIAALKTVIKILDARLRDPRG